MSVPATNTTCDIYRSGNAPPASPDVAGVACQLLGSFRTFCEVGEVGTTLSFTHVLLVDPTVDIRDDYQGDGLLGGSHDTVYIPDKDGTQFKVRFVERATLGTASDHKRMYLDRGQPSWPTDDL